MSILNPETTVFLADIGYSVKLLSKFLSKFFEPKKPWEYKQLRELGPDHSCL